MCLRRSFLAAWIKPLVVTIGLVFWLGTQARAAGQTGQTIAFPQPAEPALAGTSVVLAASASSGLPVSFTVVSGPASVSGTNGSLLTYTGVGTVVVEADQAGNTSFAAAASMQDTVTVTALTQPIGATSTAVTTVVTFSTPGVLGAMRGLIQGAENKDFTPAPGGTCAIGSTYAAGDTCTVAFTFTPTRPGLRFGGLTLADGADNLLANSYVYGLGMGPQVVYAPATQKYLGTGFTYPTGAAVDGNGNVYVTDYIQGTVTKIPSGGGAEVSFGPFLEASDVAVDGSGNVFVMTRSTVSELVAVNGALPASPTIRTLSTAFIALNGMKVDGNGNVYLASGDTSGGNSGIFELVAVNGTIPLQAPTRTLIANVGGPTGVAPDVNGDIFFSNQSDHAAEELVAVNGTIPANPPVTTLFAGLSSPSNIARDAAGNLFVTDAGAGAIFELHAVNGVVPPHPAVTESVGFTSPQGLGVDASGNIFVADQGQSQAVELDFADPPTLNFATTLVGSVSSDSPRTVTLYNDGNATLDFPPPSMGVNPAISTGFTLDPGTTCPLLAANSNLAGSLAVSASCTEEVSFAPVAAGPDHGTLVITDNNEDQAGAQQTILLNATGVTPTITITVAASPTPVFLLNPVTLTASVTSNTGTQTGLIVFLDGGTAIGSAPLSGGIAMLTTSTLALGSHSITASYASSLGTVTGGPASVLVEDFSLTLNDPAVTIQHGGTATFTYVVSPIGGPTMPAAIAFTVLGYPGRSVLSFSPASAAAGSGTTTLTLTIKTPDYPTGPILALNSSALGKSGIALACVGLGALLLPFQRRTRRPQCLLTLLLLLSSSLLVATLSGCGSGWKTQYFVVTVTGSSGPLSHEAAGRITSAP